MLAGLVFGMISTRWLSKHDYATIRQTFLAYEFAAPLLMLGLPNAVYYFFPREQGMKRGVIVDNTALLAAGGLLFSLFIACGGHQLLAMRFDNPDLRHTLSWLMPYPLIMMPIAGFAAVMVCADRTRTLAVYNVLSSLTLTIASITAVLWTQSYTAPVVVRIVIPALFLPVAFGLMFKAVPGSLRWPNWTSMQQMVRYSVPLGLATMLGSITLQLHAVVVASLCSPEDFAVYINGAMEIPVISIVTGSITTVVFAEMADLCHRGDKKAALDLFHKAAAKSACILLPTMCFLFVIAEPFILTLYSDKYYASILPFRIYLLILPIRVVVYGSALMALGMTRVILVRSAMDLGVNAILCFIFVELTGYLGAAIAIIVTLYSWTVPYNLVKIGHGFGVRWHECLPVRDLFRILTISLICTPFPLMALFLSNSYLSVFIGSLLYWPLVCCLLWHYKYLAVPECVVSVSKRMRTCLNAF